MVKILNQEKKYFQFCPTCGCLFTHDPSDIGSDNNIECPRCHNSVFARDVRTLCEKVNCRECPDLYHMPHEAAERPKLKLLDRIDDLMTCSDFECYWHLSRNSCGILNKIRNKCINRFCIHKFANEYCGTCSERSECAKRQHRPNDSLDLAERCISITRFCSDPDCNCEFYKVEDENSSCKIKNSLKRCTYTGDGSGNGCPMGSEKFRFRRPSHLEV